MNSPDRQTCPWKHYDYPTVDSLLAISVKFDLPAILATFAFSYPEPSATLTLRAMSLLICYGRLMAVTLDLYVSRLERNELVGY
jgi:hypothetical protein